MDEKVNLPREIGKLTPEQLIKEREARAAREELFRRICIEAEATGSTFEQAASRLGVPQPIVEYFQADHESAKAAWTKGLDYKSSNPIAWRIGVAEQIICAECANYLKWGQIELSTATAPSWSPSLPCS